MKERQNKRWGLKLISLLGAFLVWLWVVNVADPIMADTVEIPIEIENGQILTDNGLTYEIVGKKTTTVSYEVHTTNAYRIRSSDFRAYVDMADMWSVTGAVPVKVEVLNNSNYLASNPVSKTTAVKFETEALQTKRFELEPILNGTPENGYQTGRIQISPSHVYLEGPESLIGQISSAGIEIAVDGLSADMAGVAVPRFYDANGNRIELSKRINNMSDSVNYIVQILKVKELTLDFEVTGEVMEGYRFTGVTCDVKSIPVAGLKTALASLNTLTIPGELLNISGASTDVVKTIDLTEILPTGISFAGTGRTEINVTMTVEPLEDEIYTVDVNYDSLVGDSNVYVYRAEPGTVNIRVRALREELDSLELDSKDLEVDVSDLMEGSHIVNVELAKELDPAYEIVSIGTCRINVTRIPESTTANQTESSE